MKNFKEVLEEVKATAPSMTMHCQGEELTHTEFDLLRVMIAKKEVAPQVVECVVNGGAPFQTKIDTDGSFSHPTGLDLGYFTFGLDCKLSLMRVQRHINISNN